MPLENDPANACIGCGPANPSGLHLAFEATKDGVASKLTAQPRFEGWPQRMHSGVLYIALLEVANWTAHHATGRLAVPTTTSALAAKRLVRTGETLILTGRAAGESPFLVRVEAATEAGEAVATLERSYAFPSKEEFLAKLGYEKVPDVYAWAFP